MGTGGRQPPPSAKVLMRVATKYPEQVLECAEVYKVQHPPRMKICEKIQSKNGSRMLPPPY